MLRKLSLAFASLALLACLFALCYGVSVWWSAPASAQQFPEREQGMMPPMMRGGGGEVAIAIDQTHIYVATTRAVHKINKATFTIEKTLELPISEPQRPDRSFKKKPFNQNPEEQ